MWTVHRPEDNETKNRERQDSRIKTPRRRWKMKRKYFAGALFAILTKIRVEEYQELLLEGTLWQLIRVMICIINLIIANNHLLSCVLTMLTT